MVAGSSQGCKMKRNLVGTDLGPGEGRVPAAGISWEGAVEQQENASIGIRMVSWRAVKGSQEAHR